MKPGNPWSVKGIQPAARQAAKDAARRHGMTLGQWLNRVIMDGNEAAYAAPVAPQPAPRHQTPPQPAPIPQPAPLAQSAPQPAATIPPKSQQLHDRIEDLAARLDSLVNKQSGQVELDQWQAQSARAPGWQDIRAKAAGSDAAIKMAMPPEPEVESKAEIFGARLSALTDKLDSVVEARAVSKSRAEQDITELEAALRNVISHIKVSDRQNTDVMKNIQSRLSELSSRSAASDKENVQQLTGTVSQMEDRLAHLSQRVVKAESGDSVQQLTGTISQMEDRLAHLSQQVMKAQSSDAVQQLTGTISQMEDRLAHLSQQVMKAQSSDSVQQLTGTISQMEDRLAHLSQQVMKAESSDTVEQLIGTISQMEDRLSHLSQRVVNAEAGASEFLSVGEKIKSLTNRLDNSLDRETDPQVQALEERTNQLATQLDDFLEAAADTKAADQYEAQLNQLAERIENTEQNFNKLSPLEDSISQLFEAVESNRNLAQENVLNASHKSIETMETIAEQAAKKAAENAAQRSAKHVAAIMADDGLNKKEMTASLTALRDEMHQLQETTIQAARRDAEQTLSAGLSGQATKAIAEPMMALRQEFDQLQDTSKNAELRNQDTLEAVHDTLEKVVERLVVLETTPPQNPERAAMPALSLPEIDRVAPATFERPFHVSDEIEEDLAIEDEAGDIDTPGENDAGHEPASLSAPSRTMPPPPQDQRIDPTFSPADAGETNLDKDHAGNPGPALNHSFLEAARRAAQAAAQTPKNLPDDGEDEDSEGEADNKFLAAATNSDKKRKTLLLVAAAVLLLVGVLSAGSLMTGTSLNVASSTPKPSAGTLANDRLAGTTNKTNKQSTEEPASALPELSPPAQTPITQNTPPAIAEATPPLIPAEKASPQAAADSITTARLNTSEPVQTIPVDEAFDNRTSESLLPEAIGPIALRRAAAAGDSTAQFEVAVRFTTGKLVPQNFGKAISWYQKAAGQGLAPAQYRLGTFYEKGRGVAKDKATARIWYERAAAKGNLKAIHNLAVIYADGSKGKPDFAKAGLWFRKAAELGLADSQYNLAILHDRGLGVSKDQAKAYFWFQVAGSQGDKDAEARAAIIEKRMSPDEITRTKLLISNWNPLTLNKNANEVALPFDGWQTASTAQTTIPAVTNSTFTQKELVVLAQGYLAKLGFEPGPADGVLGAKTRQAIEKFQQQHQLPVSGKVNTRLVGKLKAAAG